MQTLYSNSKYRVVDNGCPGLKIYNRLLERVDLYNFGAFYDDMGDPYPPIALDAAIQVADRAEKGAEPDPFDAALDACDGDIDLVAP